MREFGLDWSPRAEVAASIVWDMMGRTGPSLTVAKICGLAVDAEDRGGHSSLPLSCIAGKCPSQLSAQFGAVSEIEVEAEEGDHPLPDAARLEQQLLECPCIVGRREGATPFVLEGGALYSRKAWRERLLSAEYLANALRPAPPWSPVTVPADSPLNSQQRAAVEVMLKHRFSVLTGGPGTGKTFTLAQALALVYPTNAALRVKLAAPTAKAGARMGQSIAAAKRQLGPAGERIPEEGLTLHRLLEPDYKGSFKRNAANPLECDWLIVDEASMMDRSLFASLVAALPAHCCLTLVGDCDQLPSVSAGTVLADCFAAARAVGAVGVLTESLRFRPDGTVAKLSGLVNAGDQAAAFVASLRESTRKPAREVTDNPVLWHEFPETQPAGSASWEGFLTRADEGFAAFLGVNGSDEAAACAALDLVGEFCILCALRRGRFGADAVTQALTKRYAHKHAPKPMLVTVNHKAYDVYNGEVGVILYGLPEVVWFPSRKAGEPPRTVPTALLPDLVPAWAITIHKSQGSEYKHLALVLPDEGTSPVLTKEILYTGLTRVKTGGQVDVWGGEKALLAAAGRSTERW